MADPPFEDRWGPEWRQELDEERQGDGRADGKVRWPAQWHPGIDDSRSIRATPYTCIDPSTIEPRPWIYGRQLLRGSLSAILAPGAVGKTTLTIGNALALASGKSLLGYRPWDGPQRVWLWNLEDSLCEIQRQIEAARLHWGLSPDEIEGRLFVDSALEGAKLCVAIEDADGFRLLDPVIDELVAELKERQIDVLIVDPFVSSHQVSENNNGAIDAVAKRWARVAVQANCAICLVHHTRKLNGQEVSAEHSRGAVALPFAARSVLVLNRMSKEEADRLAVSGEDRRLYFRVYDDKNNRAPPADKSDWFRLSSVDLGNGTPDSPSDHIGVATPWTPQETFDGVTADHLLKVQGLIADGKFRKSEQADDWVGVVVADVLGLDVSDRKGSDAKRVKRLLDEWIRSGALRVSEELDGNRKPRPFIRVGTLAVDTIATP